MGVCVSVCDCMSAVDGCDQKEALEQQAQEEAERKERERMEKVQREELERLERKKVCTCLPATVSLNVTAVSFVCELITTEMPQVTEKYSIFIDLY